MMSHLQENSSKVIWKKYPEFEVVDSFYDPEKAMQFVQSHRIDVIFLDIEMPKLNGVEFARNAPDHCKIIFTTAYDQFAIEGYELNVIDYILKPITASRFDQGIQKVVSLLQMEQQQRESLEEVEEKHLLFKSSHEILRVNTNDIIYIESLHKYIKVVTYQQSFTTLYSISAIEEALDPNFFFRCHRSYIINLARVNKISGLSVELTNQNSVPISKAKKTELIERLNALP